MLIDDDCDDDASFDEKYKLTSGAEHLLDEIMTVEGKRQYDVYIKVYVKEINKYKCRYGRIKDCR